MIRVTAAIFLILLGCALPARLLAATLYVDGVNGNNAFAGTTPATAWRTIQRAADAVNPGDEVLIQPGVYFESVQITRTGTAEQPITFRAGGPGVIVSGAHPAIRAGQTVWTAEITAPHLYSTPLSYEPATVLADGIDLFPYQTLAELQTFTLANLNNTDPPKPAPGPRHGFAFVGGRLYVRLNAAYGPLHPAQRTMKVSPQRGGGFRGDVIQSPTDYNWSVQTTTPAYVVLDGFTCESPGFTGVWVKYGNVTVRNCTFLGCRTGVRGWGEAESQLPPGNQFSADVIVQGCEYSQFPAWQDMLDVVADAEALAPAEQAALPGFFWWSRKGGARTSEIGLVTAAGLRWKILGNYVHNTVDAISFLSVSWSDECEIAYNRFEKLIDNAVESENHALHLRAHHNFIRDVFEPLSYQPNGGVPFPASIWFYRNIVTLTPEASAFFKKPILKWTPGCIKIKPSGSSFTGIGLDGLLIFNNTLHFPSGKVLTMNTTAADAATIKFYNNIVIANLLQNEVVEPSFAGTTFVRNVVASADAGQLGPGAVFAGTGGQVFTNAAQLGLDDIAGGRFGLLPGSPAIGAGVVVAEMPGTSVDAGALPVAPAFPRLDDWRFHFFYDQLFVPGWSGLVADPETDGLGNILESLLARHPLIADSAGAIAQSLDATSRLTLTFTRRTPLPADLQWRVEASGNLAGWQSGNGITETLPSAPAGTGLVTEKVRDLTVSTAAARRFLRLRGTQLDVPPGRVPIFDPAPPAATGEVFTDGFTDGARTNGNDALDAAWLTVYPPSGGTAPMLSIVNDASLGSGNALSVNNATDPAQTGSKTVVTSFPRATLAATGDQLALSFQVRFATIAANHAQNFFRFGPYDSHATPFTADNQYNSPGHNGYLASVNFGTTTAIPTLLEESGADGNINSGNDLTTISAFGSSALSLTTGVTRYTVTLTFTKTATAVTGRLQVVNAAGAALLNQTVTDPTPLTTFNELIFSTSQSEADYLLDNVTVNFTPAGG